MQWPILVSQTQFLWLKSTDGDHFNFATSTSAILTYLGCPSPSNDKAASFLESQFGRPLLANGPGRNPCALPPTDDFSASCGTLRANHRGAVNRRLLIADARPDTVLFWRRAGTTAAPHDRQTSIGHDCSGGGPHCGCSWADLSLQTTGCPRRPS